MLLVEYSVVTELSKLTLGTQDAQSIAESRVNVTRVARSSPRLGKQILNSGRHVSYAEFCVWAKETWLLDASRWPGSETTLS